MYTYVHLFKRIFVNMNESENGVHIYIIYCVLIYAHCCLQWVSFLLETKFSQVFVCSWWTSLCTFPQTSLWDERLHIKKRITHVSAEHCCCYRRWFLPDMICLRRRTVKYCHVSRTTLYLFGCRGIVTSSWFFIARFLWSEFMDVCHFQETWIVGLLVYLVKPDA